MVSQHKTTSINECWTPSPLFAVVLANVGREILIIMNIKENRN